MATAYQRRFNNPVMYAVQQPTPTAWDRQLMRHGLTEQEAIHALRTHAELRSWVRANGTRLFVPEKALAILGMMED